MTTTIRVASSGEAPNIALPQEVLEQLGIKVGDNLQLLATSDGFSLRRQDNEDEVVESQMAIANKVIEKRTDMLRRLAE